MKQSRRDFLLGGAACVAGGVCMADGGRNDALPPQKGPNLAVLISDLHYTDPMRPGSDGKPVDRNYVLECSRRFVAEIVSMRPRPSLVVCLGDVSWAFGDEGDYEIAERELRPLEDAGIRLVMTVGNHDLREPFLKHLGKWCAPSPVDGRIVAVVPMPTFDMVVLDSLKEPPPGEYGNRKFLRDCELGKAQAEWLKDFLAKAARPVILASHHPSGQLRLTSLVASSPRVFGYIHGHEHRWVRNFIFDWRCKLVVRSQGLPSFGLDRDVGYAVLRSFRDRAELEYVAKDWYLPRPVPKSERPPLWDDLLRDNIGRKVVFPFAK